jgi:hypothetical protein
MTLNEARIAAQKPMQATNNDPNAYIIPFEKSELSKSMIGKILASKTNNNSLKIVEWVAQNYIMKKNETEEYVIMPVMYTLQMLPNFIIK